jgi:outer membrane receptor protein involved in Fe transport
MYLDTIISRNSGGGGPLLFATGIALAVTALVGVSEPAFAQGNDAEAMDEIIVTTARRREESLMEVPLSISVIGGVDLERVGAADIIEIAKQSPNVTLEVSRGTNTTLTAFIRGVGQQDPVAGFEAGVGLYVDDVYFNRPHAAVLDLYEIERIEVLRGPQGTLYGRNTIGGAIKYVTKRIEDDPMVRVRGSVGNYGQLDNSTTRTSWASVRPPNGTLPTACSCACRATTPRIPQVRNSGIASCLRLSPGIPSLATCSIRRAA